MYACVIKPKTKQLTKQEKINSKQQEKTLTDEFPRFGVALTQLSVVKLPKSKPIAIQLPKKVENIKERVLILILGVTRVINVDS